MTSPPGPRPSALRWLATPLLLAMLHAGAASAQSPAEEGGRGIRGPFADLRAGLLAAGSSSGRSVGLQIGARVGYGVGWIRPVLAATLGRTSAPSPRAAEVDRSWVLLSAGLEVVLSPGPLDLALALEGGAARRHDDGGGSPHWSPLAGVGIHLRRGGSSGAPRWSFGVTLFQDDVLDRLVDDARGPTHLVLGGGIVLF